MAKCMTRSGQDKQSTTCSPKNSFGKKRHIAHGWCCDNSAQAGYNLQLRDATFLRLGHFSSLFVLSIDLLSSLGFLTVNFRSWMDGHWNGSDHL